MAVAYAASPHVGEGGDPCALVVTDVGPLAALIVNLAPDGDRTTAIYSVTNPDKLTGARGP